MKTQSLSVLCIRCLFDNDNDSLAIRKLIGDKNVNRVVREQLAAAEIQYWWLDICYLDAKRKIMPSGRKHGTFEGYYDDDPYREYFWFGKKHGRQEQLDFNCGYSWIEYYYLGEPYGPQARVCGCGGPMAYCFVDKNGDKTDEIYTSPLKLHDLNFKQLMTILQPNKIDLESSRLANWYLERSRNTLHI